MRLLWALAAAMLLAACAPAGPAVDDPPEDRAGDGVPAALDFSLPDLNGGQVDGAELVGRDVVLWFWAPW